MREGLGEWIYPWVMARGIFESGKESFQKLQGFFQRNFQKAFFFKRKKHFGLSPNKRGKPPRPEIKF